MFAAARPRNIDLRPHREDGRWAAAVGATGTPRQ